jgi:glycerol-3-phosphate dehydrogenase
MSDTEFDLIIIGAGINGAGIARDAALRGLKVLLLDKADFGSGTSSASTRLIHGGLRYLEHGELGLVRESLREREILLRIAPHLVRPLPILIPIYKGGLRGQGTIRAGMIAYDLLAMLSGRNSLPRHRMLSPVGTLEKAPGISAHDLSGAALYYDAQVEFAERLVLENVLAATESGAIAITYARVDKIIAATKTVRGVEYTDLIAQTQHRAFAPLTINAAGPWVDQLAGALGAERMIGGTKGSHLVVGPFPGAPLIALYVEAQFDQRPFFIIPWNGQYLIGTTDIRYDGEPDNVKIEEREIEYLLAETNRVIPQAKLTAQSILFTYSGVRPLAYSRNQSEAGITRRHFIHDHAPDLDGLISIVGGKLTTYRSLAEQAVELVFKKLRRASPPCLTDRRPLPGAQTRAGNVELGRGQECGNESGLDPSAERLPRVYGTRARLVCELAAAQPALREVFSPQTGAIAAEVVFSFLHERARTLADCLLRRLLVGLTVSMGEAAAAAQIAQEHLGWSKERAARELSAYRKSAERFQGRGER